jgi:hypothetical protein
MRHLFLPLASLLLAGCSPFMSPMIPRLDAEHQAEVDTMWGNLLVPPDRTDHEILLATLDRFSLYVSGVDRASYRAEKVVKGLLVQMEITFDRERPRFDRFTVSVYAPDGALLRREDYTRGEVEALGQQWRRWGELSARQAAAATRPAEVPALTAGETAEMLRFEYRQAAVIAATQPAEK